MNQSRIENPESKIERIEIDLLLEAIHRRSGYDFRSYARASIERRIRQFLSNSGCSTISEMTGRALHDEDFLSKLVQFFSVSVTEISGTRSFTAPSGRRLSRFCEPGRV